MFQLKTDISNLFRVSITLVFFAAFFLGVVVEVFGQENKKRTYANFQASFETGINLGLVLLTGSVQNDPNPIDGNVKTYSTLSVPVGIAGLLGATQFLEFTGNGNHNTVRTIAPNTQVMIKLSFPQEVLGLLSGVEIGYYKNLKSKNASLTNRAGYDSDEKTPVFSGSTLLNLLNGTGEFEITLTPTESFNGVYVKLSGNGLSVLLSNNLYHAYIYEDFIYTDCTEKNTPIDVLSGTRSGSIGALTSLGGVTNPYNAINGNLNDHATMTVGVGALNTIYLNTIFPTPSEAGQRVRILLEDPGGLLNLGLLSSFKIQPMLGSVTAGPQLEANSSLLSLRLLPGTTKYELAYTVNEVFDRIEIRLDNTVTALTSLKVYDVSRAPGIILIDNPSEALNGCGQVDLNNAIANYQPDHYTYNYYTNASGGTPLASSLITTSGNYYIEAVDPVTGCASPRVMVTVTVTPLPTLTLSSETSICFEESSATLNYSNVTNGGNQYKITWNEEISGLNNVEYTAFPSSGPIIISGLNSITDGNYNGTLTIRNSSTGCESEPYNFTLKVLPTPGRAQMTIQNTSN